MLVLVSESAMSLRSLPTPLNPRSRAGLHNPYSTHLRAAGRFFVDNRLATEPTTLQPRAASAYCSVSAATGLSLASTSISRNRLA